jgi:hypothetical protein
MAPECSSAGTTPFWSICPSKIDEIVQFYDIIVVFGLVVVNGKKTTIFGQASSHARYGLRQIV